MISKLLRRVRRDLYRVRVFDGAFEQRVDAAGEETAGPEVGFAVLVFSRIVAGLGYRVRVCRKWCLAYGKLEETLEMYGKHTRCLRPRCATWTIFAATFSAYSSLRSTLLTLIGLVLITA